MVGGRNRKTWILLLALFAVRPAQAAPGDAVLAEELYGAARAALERGDVEVACRRFQASQRLDATPSALLGLADCQERQGRIASAWLGYREVLELLPTGDPRRQPAEERAQALAPRLPRLEVHLLDGMLQGGVIEVDGAVVARAAQGLPLPVDPGAHRISVSAASRLARDYFITLAEGESVSLAVDAGGYAAPPIVSPPSSGTPPLPAGEPAHAGGNARRTAGYVIGGAGAVSLAIGIGAGLAALSKKNDADEQCLRNACSQRGVNELDSARSLATVADVGVVLGLAGLGFGAYFVLSSDPGGERTTAAVTPLENGGALAVGRTF
jgi:hypothetical protein